MKMSKRRGIGTVLASAVMVFLMVFTISQLYIFGIDELDNYNNVAAQVFALQSQKLNEHLSISNVVLDTSGAINPTYMLATFTVANTGGTTSQIVAVWVDNVDLSTSPHTRVPENIFLGQGLSTTISNLNTGILKSALVKMTLKVVTALGNTVTVQLLPPGLAGTTAQTSAAVSLTLVPPNPITGNNVGVILTVTNTNSLGVAFTSIAPDLCIVQGGAPLTGSAAASGTVASATSTTLSVTGTPWTANQWTNYVVKITSGTGAGQSKSINSNTANQLTTSSPWTTNPDATSQYSLYPVNASCHSKTQVMGTATSPPLSAGLKDSNSPSWSVNQWAGYLLVITAGTGGNLQSRLILSNTVDTLVVNAWTTPPDGTSSYEIRTNFCNTNSGTTSDSPVSCTKVQGPVPSGLTFLPAGGSIIFQWTYLTSSIVPDTPISFLASYVNITTTAGLLVSQIPSQVATVRQVGGTSSQGGQGIANFLGSLTVDLTSFQYAKNVAGVCWKTGFQPKGGDTTVFRIHVTNIGSTTITLTQNSEFVDLLAATGGGGQLQPQEWFIALGAQVVGGNIAPGIFAMPVSGGVTITPGQTVAVYFGSSSQNSASAPSLPASGNRLFTFMILLGTQTGPPSTPASFGESIPFVGLTTTSSDAGVPCFSGSY